MRGRVVRRDRGVTVLGAVTQLGVIQKSTDTEVQVVILTLLRGHAAGVVIKFRGPGAMWTPSKLLTAGVCNTEVFIVQLVTDVMVTEAGLDVVCGQVLALVHTVVGLVSSLYVQVVVAGLALQADLTLGLGWDGEVVLTPAHTPLSSTERTRPAL